APSVAKPSPWRHPPKEPSLANTATTAELAVATPAELVRNPATAHPWPKWFWPGVATVLALSGLILAVRTVIHRGAEEQPAVAMNAESSDSRKPAEGTIALVAPKEPDSVTIEPSATNRDNPTSSASGAQAAAKVLEPQADTAIQSDLAPNVVKSDIDNGASIADVRQSIPQTDPAVPPNPQPAVSPGEVSGATLPHDAPPIADRAVADHDRNGPQRTLQRVPPRVVNVAARLTGPIRGLEVRGQSLSDFLALLSDL